MVLQTYNHVTAKTIGSLRLAVSKFHERPRLKNTKRRVTEEPRMLVSAFYTQRHSCTHTPPWHSKALWHTHSLLPGTHVHVHCSLTLPHLHKATLLILNEFFWNKVDFPVINTEWNVKSFHPGFILQYAFVYDDKSYPSLASLRGLMWPLSDWAFLKERLGSCHRGFRADDTSQSLAFATVAQGVWLEGSLTPRRKIAFLLSRLWNMEVFGNLCQGRFHPIWITSQPQISSFCTTCLKNLFSDDPNSDIPGVIFLIS